MVYGIVLSVLFMLTLVSASDAQTSCDNPRDFTGQSKIVGGSHASIGHWPGQVGLRYFDARDQSYVYFCGGALIADRWVLTAAHCVDGSSRSIEVVLGSDDLARIDRENTRRADQIVIHEAYGSAQRGNDIALIRLAQAWSGPSTRLSLSPRRDPSDSSLAPLLVAGFGTQKYGQSLERHRSDEGQLFFAGSKLLLETVVPLASQYSCQSVYPNGVIGDQQICAGYVQGGKDSCQGDSGGPLVTFDGDGCPYQVGIVSWGAGCAEANAYGVYTRVSAYADWITRHTGPLDRIALNAITASSAPPSKLVDAVFTQLKAELAPAHGRAVVSISRGHEIKLGQDAVFKITSSVSGRLILIDINANGAVAQLFPNRFSDQTRITAEQPFTVPDKPSYRFPAQEPVGRGKLVTLIVPDSFNMAALQETKRTKGFGVEAALPYWQNLIQLIRNATGAKGFELVATDPSESGLPEWALGSLDYEIVP